MEKYMLIYRADGRSENLWEQEVIQAKSKTRSFKGRVYFCFWQNLVGGGPIAPMPLLIPPALNKEESVARQACVLMQSKFDHDPCNMHTYVKKNCTRVFWI